MFCEGHREDVSSGRYLNYGLVHCIMACDSTGLIVNITIRYCKQVRTLSKVIYWLLICVNMILLNFKNNA